MLTLIFDVVERRRHREDHLLGNRRRVAYRVLCVIDGAHDLVSQPGHLLLKCFDGALGAIEVASLQLVHGPLQLSELIFERINRWRVVRSGIQGCFAEINDLGRGIRCSFREIDDSGGLIG